jgi:hypothetical protein
MKHKDFKPCHLCGKGVMHAGHPLFLRISVDRLGIDAKAVQRAHGMELMMGGNALLANIMGPDEDLTKVIDGRHDMLICIRCASEPLPPYFWLDDCEEEQSTTGSATA